MILVIFLYAALASTFVIAKHVVALAKPFFIIGFRMILAGTLLTTYGYWSDKTVFKSIKKDLYLFLKTALFHVYFAFVLEFWALQYLSSIKTNLMYSTTPFIAAFLSYVLLGERLTKVKWGAMFLGIVSLVPLFALSAQEGGSALTTVGLPDLVLLIAVFSASYAWFLVKQLISKGYSLPIINGIAMLSGGFGALMTSFVFEGFAEPLVYDWPAFIQWILILIFMANILVYNLYGYLLRHYSLTFISLSGLLCPVFGAFFGWFFLQEPLFWNHAVSLVGLAVALYLFQCID